MGGSLKSCRRWAGILLCLTVTTSGCEGEDGFSLTPPGLDLSKAGIFKSREPEPCSETPDAERQIRALLEGANAERARHGLRPLRLDPILTSMAAFWACRMIDDDFFGHEDPYDGSTVDSRAVNFGYSFRKIGENLAAGHASAREALAHWMRSPGHRANLLDPAYVDVGIAVRHGGEYGVYWVTEFGRQGGTSGEAGVGGTAELEEAAPETSTQPVTSEADGVADVAFADDLS